PRDLPRSWPNLCSSCYGMADYNSELLSNMSPTVTHPLIAGMIAIAPGLQFLIEEQWGRGSVLLSTFALFLFVASFGFFIVGSVGMGLLVALSVFLSLYRVYRVRLHVRNLQFLKTYKPLWPD